MSNPIKAKEGIGVDMRIVPPRLLLFSGGGIRGASYLGVVQVLQEHKILQHIREFGGVSVGALTALLLALGYSLEKLERFTLEYNFGDVRQLELETILESIDNFGIDSGENVEKLVKKILHHKGFGPTTTFQELQSSNRCKGLRVWASDVQMFQQREFSANLTPNVSIVTAIHASVAIPFYFTPVKCPLTGHLLCDGGVLDNYPISSLTEEEQQTTLGVVTEYSKLPIEQPDFLQFITMICSGYYKPSYQKLIEQHRNKTIVIPCSEVSALHFEAPVEEKRRLVELGQQATRTYLETVLHTKAVTIRRHSVT